MIKILNIFTKGIFVVLHWNVEHVIDGELFKKRRIWQWIRINWYICY